MSTDLLFSILPREGKVPIAHDSQKVAKIDRQEVLRALSDKEKELKGEEKDAREKQQHQNERKPDHEKVIKESNGSEHKKTKEPKHLDVYV
jgi:hypothetical protein